MAKKVHFNTDGSNNLLVVIHYLKDRSTPKEICGDKIATMRGDITDDPHYCMIAQMRYRRLFNFRRRAMAARKTHWRTNLQKLRSAFACLKWRGTTQTCISCHKTLEMSDLSTRAIITFDMSKWCLKCHSSLLFTHGSYRTSAAIKITDLM